MTYWLRLTNLLAGGCGLLFLQGPVLAADHRDAPVIDQFSAVDINDLYMFRAPADSSKLVVVMTTHPLSNPDFATSYHYQPDAVYRFFFTTNEQATPTSQVDFVFSPFENGKQTFHAVFPNGITVVGEVTEATVNSGPPNEPIVTEGPAGSDIMIFTGPRDDPFFFDLVGFNRVVAGTGGFTGIDRFSGFNVNAIVAQFPISLVVGGAQQFAAWAVTYTATGDAAGKPITDPASVQLEQRDRMGNPAVNTALISPPLKDAYNTAIPENDPRDFAPVILKSLDNFGTNPQNTQILASVAVPDTLKFDVSKPDEYPNGRRLSDDVIDTLLTLIFNGPTSDGVNGNDAAFLDTFPYLAPPHQAQP